MSEHEINLTVSADIIRYLQGHGMKLREIGKLMDVSESFMSMVRNRKRSLTIEHLSMLADAMKVPLPILLMETIKPGEDEAPEIQELYKTTSRVLERLGALGREKGAEPSGRKKPRQYK